MSTLGFGYGSEWHLLKWMGRHRRELNVRLFEHIPSGVSIEWLDFQLTQQGKEKEWKGLDFLDSEVFNNVVSLWKEFWPQTGNPQNWDAIGWLNDKAGHNELLLIEAKGNIEELTSDSQAKSQRSQLTIQNAFQQVKQDLGINAKVDWLNGYYQYANRMTILWFLLRHNIPARLVFLYFCGDKTPGKKCPSSQEYWKESFLLRAKNLGIEQIPPEFSKRIHTIFLEVK